MRRMLTMLAAAMLLLGLAHSARAEEAPRLSVRVTMAVGHDAPTQPIHLIREQHGRIAWRRLETTALTAGSEQAWGMPDTGRLLLKLGDAPAGYDWTATVDGATQTEATRIWLDTDRGHQVEYALAQNPPPRFAARVALTAPISPHKLTLLTGAGEISVAPGEIAQLPIAPVGRLTLALPEAYPLAIDSVRWADEEQVVTDGRCAIAVAPDAFFVDATDALLKTAALDVSLTPLPLPPSMDILPADQPVAVGQQIRRVLRVVNPALMEQQVALEYKPDPLRWLVEPLGEAEPTDVREDGTLCWERTLPAATWQDNGQVVPAVLEIPLVLTALPLPEGMGFAEATQQWGVGEVHGEERIALVAPVLSAAWAMDNNTLAEGQTAEVTLCVTNTGGAAGQANIALTLPEGVRLADVPPHETVWQVDVPAGAPHAPVKIERRFVLEMQPDALDARTGYRAERLVGEVNARPLPALNVALTAARLAATRSFSTVAVAPNEAFFVRWRIVNTGAAPGEVVLVQQMPRGVGLFEASGEANAPERRDDGALVWRVTVPPMQPEGTAPGELVLSARLHLAATQLREHASGRWPLNMPATLNGQPQTVQSILALAADVAVSVAVEPVSLRPGRHCEVKISLRNDGAVAAPVTVETNIPAGFALVSGDAGGTPTLDGQTLRWVTELAADQAHTIVYRLRAGALNTGEMEREDAHAVRVAVAQGAPREAAITWTRTLRPSLWEMLVMDGWIALPLVVLCAATGVLCFVLMRKRREN